MPSRRTWNLTVTEGWLAFVAPHGTFPAVAIADELRPRLALLPAGTELEVEASGDRVGELAVTAIVRIKSDLRAHVTTLDDSIVGADGKLALARARARLAKGDMTAAAEDVAVALQHGIDEAIEVHEQLPAQGQARLLDALAAWQAPRLATWRALRHLSLARWSDDHLTQALEMALALSGVFGSAPGITGEALIAELASRRLPTASWTTKLGKRLATRAAEGDSIRFVVTELEQPRVVGADDRGVYVCGVKVSNTVVQVGAKTRRITENQPVLIHYGPDGTPLQRWDDMASDRVLAGVALQTEYSRDHSRVTPRGIRLADGQRLYEYSGGIQHLDGALLWGILDKNWSTLRMQSELRRITGEPVLALDEWIEELRWDDRHIHITGPAARTLDRTTGAVVDLPPAPEQPRTIELLTASGPLVVEEALAPWHFGYWTTLDAIGWRGQWKGKQLHVAPPDPGAPWVSLELAREPAAIQLAPPWLAIHREREPILLIALAELLRAPQLRVQGKPFLKRIKGDPRPRPPAPIVKWFEVLVAAGITESLEEPERDAMLLRTLEQTRKPTPDSLARVLGETSPFVIDHDTHWLDSDDEFYAELAAALADDGITFAETRRVGERDDPMITLTARRGKKHAKRTTEPMIYDIASAADDMLVELGASRRLYTLARYQDDTYCYLVCTPAQRARLVAAKIAGIGVDANG